MSQAEHISLKEAQTVVTEFGLDSVTTVTIRNWGKKNSFASKLGGRWKINKKKFEQFLAEGVKE